MTRKSKPPPSWNDFSQIDDLEYFNRSIIEGYTGRIVPQKYHDHNKKSTLEALEKQGGVKRIAVDCNNEIGKYSSANSPLKNSYGVINHTKQHTPIRYRNQRGNFFSYIKNRPRDFLTIQNLQLITTINNFSLITFNLLTDHSHKTTKKLIIGSDNFPTKTTSSGFAFRG